MTTGDDRESQSAGDPAADPAPAPRVFISYSHDSAEHKERVRALCEKLRSDGVDALIDQYVATEGPPQGWPRWMDEQLRDAQHVIVVCTPTYRLRIEGREEPGRGQGVLWEGTLIYQLIYNAGTRNERFVPVLLADAKADDIPLPLQGGAFYRADDDTGYEDLYRRLTGQPRVMATPLGQRRTLPPLPRSDRMPEKAAPPPSPPSPQPRPRRKLAVLVALGLTAAVGFGLFGKGLIAHEVTVTGVVVDSQRQPIPRVTVTVVGSPASAVTNGAGYFSLPVRVPAGQMVQVQAQAEGWQVTAQGHPAGSSPVTLVLER